ncbi:deazaflavin-dependent oxidoreductase, nitroreductase family [Rhodococcus tukisamuensis]|uniref:Deazaflavin-dependent oxidoreductase, nitroreductase family n=2 Tax=Rhodococcus tukisamuensis TaxID=168276 RepID=A0A1G6TYN2_9NOCA|nr:deazaflavin-dependent oxidoreductase, nitroreductase family [Rhodococcus tukisamuensis]
MAAGPAMPDRNSDCRGLTWAYDLRMPLRYVDPAKKHGPVYKATERFGRSRIGQLYVRKIASRTDPWVYRVTGGRLPSRDWSVPSAPLRTTGAKSGLPREVQVSYFHDGSDPILIASNYGGARHPHWYHNLIAHPECQLGGERFVATAITGADEHERLYALAERVYAGYHDYRVKTAPIGRQIPVFRLSRSESG